MAPIKEVLAIGSFIKVAEVRLLTEGVCGKTPLRVKKSAPL